MKIDIGGAIKDNKKILLLLLAAVALLIFISVVNGRGGVFNFSEDLVDTIGDNGGLGTTPLTTGNTDSNVPRTVNNGNNAKYSSPPGMQLKTGVNYFAKIETSKGDIEIDLYEQNTPINVNNFVFLSTNNFYDGSSFHRVIKDFVIQGGDPVGDGTGGPGYRIIDEILKEIRFRPYMVAMANSGKNTNGSQFFITTKRFSDSSLNGGYTIIGEVSSGFDVVDSIEGVRVGDISTSVQDVPLTPVRINNVDIIER